MSANLLPALDSATERALRASIQRFGVLVPVLLDQHGELVDGHHRKRIAEDEGKSCPEQMVHLPDDPEERAAALTSVNDDRRPRISPEQRREVVTALRADGHSTRAIAGAVGVDHSTVVRDLASDESGGASAPPDASQTPPLITGTDGKSYPARKKPHGNSKLDAQQQDEIAQRLRRGEQGKALAEEFGVSTNSISKIANQNGTRRNRKGSDHKSFEGMASAAAALAGTLADLDTDAVVEHQDATDVARWVRDLNACRLALGPVIKGLNGGKLP